MLVTKWRHIERADPSMLRYLANEAPKRNLDVDAILGVINHESRFASRAKNSGPEQTASGLIQMIDSTARKVGTTAAALRNMSQREQAPYVLDFYGLYQSLNPEHALRGSDYLVMGLGAKPWAPDTTVLFSRDEPKRWPRKEPKKNRYDLNTAPGAEFSYFDVDRSGDVTIGDVRAYWDAYATRELENGVFEIDTTPPKTASGPELAWMFPLFLILPLAAAGGRKWRSLRR